MPLRPRKKRRMPVSRKRSRSPELEDLHLPLRPWKKRRNEDEEETLVGLSLLPDEEDSLVYSSDEDEEETLVGLRLLPDEEDSLVYSSDEDEDEDEEADGASFYFRSPGDIVVASEEFLNEDDGELFPPCDIVVTSEESSNENGGELSPPGDIVVASEESEEDTSNAEEALGSFFVNGLRRSRRFPTNLLGSVQLGGVRRSARLLRR